MKLKHFIFYPILTGLILFFAWPANGCPFFILFGFVPLMILEYKIKMFSLKKIFLYSFLSFFIWNVGTTYWIMHASFTGMLVAVILNSIFMSSIFLIYSFVRHKTNFKIGVFSLIFLWISFEYLHYNWDLSWTWLSLGNVFANYPSFIQWYEFTGVLGGSLWVLVSNILIFYFIINKKKKYLYYFFSLSIVLTFLSLILKDQYFNSEKKVDVVIVQPNIDPRNEKFNIPIAEQVYNFLNIADSKIDSSVNFLVFPETFLDTKGEPWSYGVSGRFEKDIDKFYYLERIKSHFQNYPNLNFIIGATTYKEYKAEDTLRFTVQKDGNIYYEIFNSALFSRHNNATYIHHKSKLVPGTESIPLPKIFGWLSNIFQNMGGVSSSLGKGHGVSVFDNNEVKFSVGICYESIFGELVSKSFTKGSELLFIITNDGWWRDSPGHKQHLSYSRLRAIENRKPIVRCANTGISCFIDIFGNINMKTSWWEEDCIRQEILTNKKITFYAKHGNYLGRISVFLSILILLYSFVFNRIKKNK